jgi:hypothetical protein
MNPSKRILPTSAELNERFAYDPQTGIITNRVCSHKALAGADATCAHTAGYRSVCYSCGKLLAHRVAWAMTYGEWPAEVIDHINGNRSDNRLCNLRQATRSQNLINSKLRSDNSSGFKGVSWCSGKKKWDARIYSATKLRLLGRFKTKEEAIAAYATAAAELHGEFAYSARVDFALQG